MQTDLSIVINGESGTGKELVAKALHEFGRRRNKPFVAVNMAAIPKDLIESELFGHEKGAFTGATSRSMGRFEQAQGGTLFLDEIGDMPAEAQTRLLRVLQEGEYTTVGGRTAIKTNVRIIAATHRDLKQLIRQGLFREDLYFRLNVASIRIPPLRERTEDIPELVRHFLTQAVNEGLPWKTITTGAMNRLKNHSWPGNVRELENMVKRLVALCAEDEIDTPAIEAELAEAPLAAVDGDEGGLSQSVERHIKAYFNAHGGTMPPPGLYDRVLREVERPLLQLTLEATHGNQLRAADVLGVNRNTLRKKIRDLDIPIMRNGGK
jgi:two-component system nitrogen regulation response regulator GlnG